MKRVRFAGVLITLSMAASFGAGESAQAQDRAGAAMAAAGQPPPPPPPEALVPPARREIGGFNGPMVGNLGIGAIAVPAPPPIGYYGPPAKAAADYNMGRFFYYPYYYFPHSYWPQQSCKWPERPGEAYQRPPAYMSYPAFMEPHWRYEWYTPQRYYRGFHFWLDQF